MADCPDLNNLHARGLELSGVWAGLSLELQASAFQRCGKTSRSLVRLIMGGGHISMYIHIYIYIYVCVLIPPTLRQAEMHFLVPRYPQSHGSRNPKNIKTQKSKKPKHPNLQSSKFPKNKMFLQDSVDFNNLKFWIFRLLDSSIFGFLEFSILGFFWEFEIFRFLDSGIFRFPCLAIRYEFC